MEQLILEPQKKTLDINCANGSIHMSGNSLLQDPKAFFKPVVDWIIEYVKNPALKTVVTLKFEYIDTSSVQSIFDILGLLKAIPDTDNRVIVNWHYELDDPELLEVGEIMEGRLKLIFNYIDYSEN